VTRDTHVGLVAPDWLDCLVFSMGFNLACSSTVDAEETASSSLSSSSSSGLGAMTEETNKRDGGGCSKKRRRHDNELEAVARNPDCLNFW
jgi:hypothetical protein